MEEAYLNNGYEIPFRGRLITIGPLTMFGTSLGFLSMFYFYNLLILKLENNKTFYETLI